MARFVLSSLPAIMYRSSVIENNPVNLDLCLTFTRGKFAWYPDNTGKPTISFKMVGLQETRLEWVYDKDQQRDDDYARLCAMAEL